jgi:hypothetical protein
MEVTTIYAAKIINALTTFLNNPETWIKYKRNIKVNDGCIKIRHHEIVDNIINRIPTAKRKSVSLLVEGILKYDEQYAREHGIIVKEVIHKEHRLTYIICRNAT